jgi:hypothetical protein
MNTYGVALVSRNDGYGGNLVSRSTYCINSLIQVFDEIIYVDWNVVNGKTLIEEIKDNLIPTDKLTTIKINPEEVDFLTNYEVDTQKCSETLGKNIGIRRLKTDFILSTSIEDICPKREDLDREIVDKNVFYIGAKRRIPLEEVQRLGSYKANLFDRLNEIKGNFPPVGFSGAYPGDIWSIINSCGDFQIASKELWFELRGFEEFLTGRGFLDTNIQKKAILSNHPVILNNNLNVFHIEHPGVSFGGYGKVNDMNKAIRNFQLPSKNKDTWGFSEYKFNEFNLMDIL